MKNYCAFVAYSVMGLFCVLHSHAADILAGISAPRVTARGPDYRVWERTKTNVINGIAITNTSRYVELESGMHRWSGISNSWTLAEEKIELSGDGAVAQNLAYHVTFAPNLNTVGAIRIVLSDGKT